MTNTIDITPNPRILRTLGEIPFQPWQCIAELIDNSVDAFSEAKRAQIDLIEKKISVTWSSEAVAGSSRTIEICDTGPGMSLTQLQNAARAGYSNNDPVHSLGLFGMGFNIATARLGESTRLLSATEDGTQWEGIEIDFAELIRTKTFSAKVITVPKKSPDEHGTKVTVSKLKGDTYVQLRDQQTLLKRQLENIYTPLLGDIDIEIYVQGKLLTAKNHCVWGRTRYVTRDGKNIPAVIEIDRDLGNALFDMDKNTYLSRDDEESCREEQSQSGSYPPNIIERQKRLKGWVGIQRFSDPNDFGIDFIRNGRKILISTKNLFSYENPMTGASKLQYPVELGTTVGGRIVGEVHVDYLHPTYQKNDFDKTDPSWNETVEALRGVGPILPNDRKAMGYTDANSSPVGKLANAYRRVDSGTRCLFVERTIAKEFTEKFKKGEADYLSDDKWWVAAQEADRLSATKNAANAPVVDTGASPSDNPDDYAPPTTTNAPPTTTTVISGATPPVLKTSKLDELIVKSTQMRSWSGSYAYGDTPAFQVKVWELNSGEILKNDESVSCAFFADGIDCDFIYNPRHSFLTQFPVEPRVLLSLFLAEKFKARDNVPDIGSVFSGLINKKLQDVRIDKVGLQEKAAAVFEQLREKLEKNLSELKKDVLCAIHESNGEVEETVMAMLSDGQLVIKFQSIEEDGFEAITYVPYRTLIRLVDRFPEQLFDGKVFSAPYERLVLSDTQATLRAKTESKDRIISFLKDALWVLGQSGSSSIKRGKDELARCSHSINFLTQEIVD